VTPATGALPFTKMHGAGNDFIILDQGLSAISADRIRALADRRTGIGCDQLIVLHTAPAPATAGVRAIAGAADAVMRIFNADGSPAGACGNATRCVAALLVHRLDRDRITIDSPSGLLAAERLAGGLIQVDMGPPLLGWQDIPLAYPCDTLHLPLAGDPAAASMGNPHATFFLAPDTAPNPSEVGPALEHNPIFPDRANIGFAQILAPDRIRLRVWERGAGLTRACGSGACAALVNAHRRGLAGRVATLMLDGGELTIEWRRSDGHVLMTGPAVTAFQGTVDLSTYPA